MSAPVPGRRGKDLRSYDAGRAPQPDANVEVVLREGTPTERRYQFPITLTHEGETLEVGSFLVSWWSSP